jgi:MHS family alpha-ketoglutarate permease-like MFS transporter
MAGTIAIQNYNTYMQKFLVNTSGYTIAEAAQAVTAALIVYTAVQPLAGWLSDVYGRRKVLIWYMAVATLDSVAIMTALSHKHSFAATFLLLIAGMVPLSLYTAPSALFKAELFPAEIRSLGVGLSFAIPVAIFGGTAELIALSLKKAGHENWYYWYMTAAMGIAWVTALLMRETKDTSLIAEE